MSISYKARRIKDPRKLGEPGKYYPVPAPVKKVTTRQVAGEIANRSGVSSTDVIASLEGLMTVIPYFLSEGFAVDLGDFAPSGSSFPGKGRKRSPG